MGFLRAIFLFAIVMLIIGIVGTHYLLANLFSSPISAATPRVAMTVHKSTSTAKRHQVAIATAAPTKLPVPPTALAPKTATPAPVATATPAVHVVTHHALRRVTISRSSRVRKAKPTATAKPLPSPTPTPGSGTVTLTSYWVGDSTAQPGQTVSIGYVINNGTGRTARITLGASIKSSHVISWLSGQINDPYHDVVAIVPPGVSTHVRYFTLPSRLRAGTYDVAWGLRNALSGGRDALVAAPDALRVRR